MADAEYDLLLHYVSLTVRTKLYITEDKCFHLTQLQTTETKFGLILWL